ncbi:deoxyguanosinetriphosphate triphosphohydrolase [Pacificispira sp.]|uniref:deoxyguanosinetriphosphate triphosphohydrolase n=1 Tax=Pacificispira sp. TaxID=2888761 RepID=UPI002EBF63BF|nr:deoxyguanosinetriphosphate triphosphohydrolase [Pseudomonadota bacterium]
MTPFRASYATDHTASRGRLAEEEPSRTRTPFQRDRDRIIHCTAFRRLQHKTQVFISPEGDHLRTRMTHSLEVAQIARSMARVLRADEDLTEAIALAHDLGHTPFGHAGEDALDAAMAAAGGFDHNDQALRVLVLLEQRYPGFDGLNLTWETLEGVVKHNGPIAPDGVQATLSWFNSQFDLEIGTHAGLEAQIAAIADDIAYNHHDMDDGLRAGLFSVEQICDSVPHVGKAIAEVRRDEPDAPKAIVVQEAVRRLIGDMVGDALGCTTRRLERLRPVDAAELRHCGEPAVRFTEPMKENERALKTFLFENMYRAPSVNREREAGAQIVRDLFTYYMEVRGALDMTWLTAYPRAVNESWERIVADYIAGMTDRFAKRLHRKIFYEE